MTNATCLAQIKSEIEAKTYQPLVEAVAEALFTQSHRGTYRFDCVFVGMDFTEYSQQFDIEAANPYHARLLLWRAVATRINAHHWAVNGVTIDDQTFTPQKGEGTSRLIREEMERLPENWQKKEIPTFSPNPTQNG